MGLRKAGQRQRGGCHEQGDSASEGMEGFGGT